MSIVRWEVTTWDDVPKMLTFDNDAQRQKASSLKTAFSTWYATEAEALAAIAERNAREEELLRVQRIKDAGPELLAALEALYLEYSEYRTGKACCARDLLLTECMTAAFKVIAKAKG